MEQLYVIDYSNNHVGILSYDVEVKNKVLIPVSEYVEICGYKHFPLRELAENKTDIEDYYGVKDRVLPHSFTQKKIATFNRDMLQDYFIHDLNMRIDNEQNNISLSELRIKDLKKKKKLRL